MEEYLIILKENEKGKNSLPNKSLKNINIHVNDQKLRKLTEKMIIYSIFCYLKYITIFLSIKLMLFKHASKKIPEENL